MLDRCQYEILNWVRKKTDAIIDGERTFEIPTYKRDDIWKFFKENKFIKGGQGFSSITFSGRVALAAYEEQQSRPCSLSSIRGGK